MRMNDDLISRQGVFDVLNGIKIPRNATWYQYYRQALDEVGCLPTISKVRTADDCISRQAAIYEIHEDADWLAAQGSDWQVERMERDKSILMSLPSIQPERLKGKWIHQAKFGRIECDQCGKVFRNTFAPKNFCPKCGADMRGEQNG